MCTNIHVQLSRGTGVAQRRPEVATGGHYDEMERPAALHPKEESFSHHNDDDAHGSYIMIHSGSLLVLQVLCLVLLQRHNL